jgi:hypothetical protein
MLTLTHASRYHLRVLCDDCPRAHLRSALLVGGYGLVRQNRKAIPVSPWHFGGCPRYHRSPYRTLCVELAEPNRCEFKFATDFISVHCLYEPIGWSRSNYCEHCFAAAGNPYNEYRKCALLCTLTLTLFPRAVLARRVTSDISQITLWHGLRRLYT